MTAFHFKWSTRAKQSLIVHYRCTAAHVFNVLCHVPVVIGDLFWELGRFQLGQHARLLQLGVQAGQPAHKPLVGRRQQLSHHKQTQGANSSPSTPLHLGGDLLFRLPTIRVHALINDCSHTAADITVHCSPTMLVFSYCKRLLATQPS